jgi:hypothetical protein
MLTMNDKNYEENRVCDCSLWWCIDTPKRDEQITLEESDVNSW